MVSGRSILVTGGSGYIGSHTLVELVNEGYNCVVLDNFCNSSKQAILRVQEITGKELCFVNFNLRDKKALNDLFAKEKFSCVIHFAGLKAVGESCDEPLMYYCNNLNGTITLLQVMAEHNVKNIIFSSSATVYGTPNYLPIDEQHPVGGSITSPYGRSKYMIEKILEDLYASDKAWNIVMLRYFNPVGAHKSGKIGEDPLGPPNNLMPFLAQVASGRREMLSIFGNDYDTPDGTGVRDYIHVVDLAYGHVLSLNKINEQCGLKVYNLGSGKGFSVVEMLNAFEEASGKQISHKFVERRSGDVATVYADPQLAERELGWKALRGLKEMCDDLWRWQSMNPLGYNVPPK